MSWLQRQNLQRFLGSSFWLLPIACMVVALALAPFVLWIDARTNWELLGFSADGAREVVGALASSLLTFLVFAFSILLLVVQMAAGQLTPRIIARVFEARLTRLTVGAFVFAWVYALAALGRIEDRVPQLPVALAVVLSLTSVGLFLLLMQRTIQSVRPVSILADLAQDTRGVIDAVYPASFASSRGEHAGHELDPALSGRVIRHQGRSGTVRALDVRGLVELAQRADCTIEVVPQVGDFQASGDDFFRLYGTGAHAVEERALNQCVALGSERTLEQDPAYGFRIIVDIASKALSPAINDPTTAALAIDQLHHLLHLLGTRQLDTGVIRDAAGSVRLVYRTPDWEDFVALAATEIRVYGATSPQATRRLQAMLDQLSRTLSEERRSALVAEASRLRRTVERTFEDPEDRALALQADLQGFGGGHRAPDSSPAKPPPGNP